MIISSECDEKLPLTDGLSSNFYTFSNVITDAMALSMCYYKNFLATVWIYNLSKYRPVQGFYTC